MRIFLFFSLMCLALVTSAQSIGNYVIVEMDTLDISDPGAYRSPWRFSRADSTLYRWNYTSSQWQIANQGILDSIANIQLDLYPPSVDSSVQLIYLAAHGLDTANFTAGVIAVKENYALASAVSSDSVQFTYIIDTPHPDSIQVKGSGQISRPAHGLAVGKVYYLTNVAGVYDTIPGSVSSPVFFVLDINTIELLEQGAESSLIISRVPIPSPFITSYGGDPRSPSDTVIQQIAELYAMIGRARPGTVFVSQFSGSTANPTHQAGNTEPSTPAHAWFWDGVQVTRISYAATSFNLQDTVYGTLQNIPLTPVVGSPPSSSQVVDWITANTAEGVSVPNGTLLYFVGSGTEANPNYIWQVVDDATAFGGLVKSVKVPFSTPQLETRGDSIGIVGGNAVLDQTLNYVNYLGTNIVLDSDFQVGTNWSGTGWTFTAQGAQQIGFGSAALTSSTNIPDSDSLYQIKVVSSSTGTYFIDVTLDNFTTSLGVELSGQNTTTIGYIKGSSTIAPQIWIYGYEATDTNYIHSIELRAVQDVFEVDPSNGTVLHIAKEASGGVRKTFNLGSAELPFIESLSPTVKSTIQTHGAVTRIRTDGLNATSGNVETSSIFEAISSWMSARYEGINNKNGVYANDNALFHYARPNGSGPTNEIVLNNNGVVIGKTVPVSSFSAADPIDTTLFIDLANNEVRPADAYALANTAPTSTSGAIQIMKQTGNGTGADPGWLSLLRNTASLDFPNTVTGSTATLTMPLTGAAVGDPVEVAPASVPAGVIYFYWVSAADTVSIRLVNMSGADVDPAATNFTAQILK